MQGKIVKGIAGFYYIYGGACLYECKARGVFRKDNQKPLVGDNVEFTVLDEEKRLGNIDPAGGGKCGSGPCDFFQCEAETKL